MTEVRICKHMNEDHQLSLFMIVKSTLGRKERNSVKISHCKMTAIDLKEAKITFAACKGETCTKREVVVKFDPPMNSFADMRLVSFCAHFFTVATTRVDSHN